jgi:hypothetical protein
MAHNSNQFAGLFFVAAVACVGAACSSEDGGSSNSGEGFSGAGPLGGTASGGELGSETGGSSPGGDDPGGADSRGGSGASQTETGGEPSGSGGEPSGSGGEPTGTGGADASGGSSTGGNGSGGADSEDPCVGACQVISEAGCRAPDCAGSCRSALADAICGGVSGRMYECLAERSPSEVACDPVRAEPCQAVRCYHLCCVDWSTAIEAGCTCS